MIRRINRKLRRSRLTPTSIGNRISGFFPAAQFTPPVFLALHTIFGTSLVLLVCKFVFTYLKEVPVVTGAPRIAARSGRNRLEQHRQPGEFLKRAMTKILTAVGIATLSFTVTACGSSTSSVSPSSLGSSPGAIDAPERTTSVKPDYAAAARPGNLTIVGIVLQDDGEFDVLQAAVIRAGLVDALNGTTQYTVFAPTDLAFVNTLGVANEAAAVAAVNSLPVDTLTDILLFHVTEGRRNSRSVLAAPSYQMLNG